MSKTHGKKSFLYNWWVRTCLLPKWLGFKEKKCTFKKDSSSECCDSDVTNLSEEKVIDDVVKPVVNEIIVEEPVDVKDEPVKSVFITPSKGKLNRMKKTDLTRFTSENNIPVPKKSNKKQIIEIILNFKF
jgi:hypothetical protein